MAPLQSSIGFKVSCLRRHLPLALSVCAVSALLGVTSPAQALTWSWSFTGNISSGQGTFSTAGSAPAANTFETITGINGTYTRSGVTYSITGLSGYAGAGNIFQWDGSGASPIVSNFNGIAFVVDGGKSINVYRKSSGIGAVDGIISTFGAGDSVVTFSSLSPINAPGPLPLFGAGAAFGWSRRLRRRVKTASLKSASLSTTTAIHSVLPPLS